MAGKTANNVAMISESPPGQPDPAPGRNDPSGPPGRAAFESGSERLADLVGQGESNNEPHDGEMPDDDFVEFDLEHEPRVIYLDVDRVKIAAGVIGVLIIALAALWFVKKGNDVTTTAAVAPTTLAPAAASTTALAQPVPTKPGVPTTAAVGATPTPAPKPVSATKLVPTTKPVPVPTTAAVGAAPAGIKAFCESAATYSLTDLITLADRVVKDPTSHEAAYANMLKNAPADIAPAVKALGPLTADTVDQVRKGAITTPVGVRDFLAAPAQAEKVTAWIKAQQQVVPVVQSQCAG